MRYGTLPKRHMPGTEWRTLAWKDADDGTPHAVQIEDDSDNHGGSVFDELVIDGWFHLEQMTDSAYWIGITREDGSRLTLWVQVGERGQAKSIQTEEDG